MLRHHLRKIRRITFLQPSAILAYPASKTAWPPLGILYLAAAARDAGFHVEFIDAILEGFDDFIPLTDDTHLFGLTPEQTAEKVLATNPDMLAISIQFHNQVEPTIKTLALIKEARPDIFNLAGGPIVTLKPDKVMELTDIDGIVLGEGDHKLTEFITHLNSGWPGELESTGVRLDDDLYFNMNFHNVEDLDAIPFPARELVDMERYLDIIGTFKILPKRMRATTMISSRGCPCSCCFCASRVLYNRTYRARSADNLIAEIDQLVDRYGIEELIFFDENFAVSRKRTVEFLDKMIERDYGLSWYSSQGFALWTIDDEIIEKLARAGCYKIKFSVESGDPRVLKEIIHKPVKLDRIPQIVQKCKDVGLATGANFILGFPGETRDELRRTYEFAKAMDVDFTIFNVAMPFPKTELCEVAKEMGYLPEDYDFEQLSPGLAHLKLPNFTQEELERWYHEYWLEINFSTPEKEERYYRYAIRNPNYTPREKPGGGNHPA